MDPKALKGRLGLTALPEELEPMVQTATLVPMVPMVSLAASEEPGTPGSQELLV